MTVRPSGPTERPSIVRMHKKVAAADHAERGVARVDQLPGGFHDVAQHGVEVVGRPRIGPIVLCARAHDEPGQQRDEGNGNNSEEGGQSGWPQRGSTQT